MTLPDVAAALRDVHTSLTQQHDLTKVVIQDAENARAEFHALTAGATNPLVNRSLGNYAQAIVRLRDGSFLLAEAGGILADYARIIGIDLDAEQPSPEREGEEPAPDDQPEHDNDLPKQQVGPDVEPSAVDTDPH